MSDEKLAGTAEEIDRTGWPRGPWDQEPDRLDFKTKAGLPAIALRHRMGHWCGYVGIAPDHPAIKSQDDLDVHGGVTYGARCGGRVCHVPAPSEPAEVFWLGFDCAHCNDASPSKDDGWTTWQTGESGVAYWGPKARTAPGTFKGMYRTLAYVREECERLSEQLR